MNPKKFSDKELRRMRREGSYLQHPAIDFELSRRARGSLREWNERINIEEKPPIIEEENYVDTE